MSEIVQGQFVTFDLKLSVTPDPGYFNAILTGGTATINSGDGQSANFSIASGQTSEDLFATFAYAAAGSYTPSFGAAASYSEQFSEEVMVGEYPVYGIVGEYCFFGCTYEYGIVGYQPIYDLETFTTGAGSNPSGQTALLVDAPTSVPEPGTLALLASGLIGLGLLSRRAAPRLAANGI